MRTPRRGGHRVGPAPLLYIAPYSRALRRVFRDSGRHALVVYDDLSKHAQSYRDFAAAPAAPGREAYPGDVFYLTLACSSAPRSGTGDGGGSLTACRSSKRRRATSQPTFRPTSSRLRRQIFLESDLFHQGVRPAINVGNSCRASAVGADQAMRRCGHAPPGPRAVPRLAGSRSLAAPDKSTSRAQSRRRLVEILSSHSTTVASSARSRSYAGTNGYIDTSRCRRAGVRNGAVSLLESR